jgi:hypothetical protein
MLGKGCIGKFTAKALGFDPRTPKFIHGASIASTIIFGSAPFSSF